MATGVMTTDFEIAGLRLRIETESSSLRDDVAARFASYEAPADGRPPDAVMEMVDRGERWQTARPYGAAFPEAEARFIDGVYQVWRKEFEGEIALGEPVRSRFQVAGGGLAFETPVRLVMTLCGAGRETLFLHASGALFGGRALVFTAKSGGGKTTLLSLLPEQTPLSDEVVGLARRPGDPADGGWIALSTPFTGGPTPARSVSGPLDAICFLRKGATNFVEPADRRTAFRRLLRNTLAYIADPGTAGSLLATVDSLSRSVSLLELEFAKSSDIGRYLRGLADTAGRPGSLVSGAPA